MGAPVFANIVYNAEDCHVEAPQGVDGLLEFRTGYDLASQPSP
jgi:hypothetical protein